MITSSNTYVYTKKKKNMFYISRKYIKRLTVWHELQESMTRAVVSSSLTQNVYGTFGDEDFPGNIVSLVILNECTRQQIKD